MTILYFAIGIGLAFLIGLVAVRHEKKQTPAEQAAARLPYLRFVRFIASWKVFIVALLISLGATYIFDELLYFVWFLILYSAFVLPLSARFYFYGGKERLTAHESGDSQSTAVQPKKVQRSKLIIAFILLGTLAYILIQSY